MTAAKDDLLALAVRCEKAMGVDRLLDAEIGEVMPLRCMETVPAYTASLDAAMTLMPAKRRLRQMAFSAPCADDRKWHLNVHGGLVGEDTFVGRGVTPALALTAAALRARAATPAQGEGDGE